VKIYKISIADSMGESRGFEYRATMREAKDAAALYPDHECEIRLLDIPVTKADSSRHSTCTQTIQTTDDRRERQICNRGFHRGALVCRRDLSRFLAQSRMTIEEETERAGKSHPDWADEMLMAHSIKGNTAECRVILSTQRADGSWWKGEKVIKVRLTKQRKN
jgi:hypothetical protein